MKLIITLSLILMTQFSRAESREFELKYKIIEKV